MKTKIKYLVLFLIVCSTAKAQIIAKQDLPVYALTFGAGLFYGEAEQLIWHNPHPGNKFWDPYTSWETKHSLINADAYHIARAGEYVCFTTAIVLSVNDFTGKNKFWQITKKFIICSAAFQTGMLITYHK